MLISRLLTGINLFFNKRFYITQLPEMSFHFDVCHFSYKCLLALE